MILLKGHASGTAIFMLAFAPDSQQLASVGNDHTLRLWDVQAGKSQVLARTRSHAVAFSPCSKWLVFGNFNQTTRIDLGAKSELDLGGEASVPQALAFSPDGTMLVSAGHCLQRYDAERWFPMGRWEMIPRNNTALAFHPRGKLVAIACVVRHWGSYERPIVLFEIESDTNLGELTGPSHDITSLAFSPNGRLLAATSGPALWVWEVISREVLLYEIINRQHFQSCAFTPDGRSLASAHNDGQVRLFETTTWSEAAAFDWGIGPVTDVVFAPDGMKAAASSKRGQIVVWDVEG